MRKCTLKVFHTVAGILILSTGQNLLEFCLTVSSSNEKARFICFFFNFLNLFIGCAGSLLLHGLFSSCSQSGLLIAVALRAWALRACGLQ